MLDKAQEQEVSKWSSQTNLWSAKSSRALSFSQGQENKIGFCHTLIELNNRALNLLKKIKKGLYYRVKLF
jgi:hypothetical protein